jgi:hypothetical protein
MNKMDISYITNEESECACDGRCNDLAPHENVDLSLHYYRTSNEITINSSNSDQNSSNGQNSNTNPSNGQDSTQNNNEALDISLEQSNSRNIVRHDSPEPFDLFYYNNDSPQIEGLEELHNNIMFYLSIILFAVV